MKIPAGITLEGAVDIHAESEDGPTVPRFQMIAYSGGVANTDGGRMAFDLEGLEVPTQKMPILLRHDRGCIAGFSTEIKAIDGKQLHVTGQLTPSTDAAQEVLALLADGFPWQASVGLEIKPNGAEYLEADKTVDLNGQEIKGPLVIVQQSILREASFVPLGADSKTSAYAFALGGNGEIDLPEAAAKEQETMAEESPRATLADLRAAFPEDSGFVLEMLENGATLEYAKGQYYMSQAEILTAKIAEADLLAKTQAEEIEKLKATTSTSRPSPWQDPVRGASFSADPILGWAQAIAHYTDNGMDKKQAVIHITATHPDLKAAYVSAVNEQHGRA